MNSGAIVIGAGPGSLGVTAAAGSGAPAAQQFLAIDGWEFDACMQQLWAALCAGCRQIPDGASNDPINRMAIAARWKTPFRMTEVYHNIEFME